MESAAAGHRVQEVAGVGDGVAASLNGSSTCRGAPQERDQPAMAPRGCMDCSLSHVDADLGGHRLEAASAALVLCAPPKENRPEGAAVVRGPVLGG